MLEAEAVEYVLVATCFQALEDSTKLDKEMS
jgi:hypothetical protein